MTSKKTLFGDNQENKKPIANEVPMVEIGMSSEVSIYDLSLDFGNKSWADLVYEEEEAERIAKLPKQDVEGKPSMQSSPKQMTEILEKDSEENSSSRSRRKERVKFKEDRNLTKIVGDSLKFERSSSRSRHHLSKDVSSRNSQHNVWQDRLRSPGKTKSSNSSSRSKPYDVAQKSPSRSGWRRRPFTDEDSQNAMDELPKSTRTLKSFADEESQPPIEKRFRKNENPTKINSQVQKTDSYHSRSSRHPKNSSSSTKSSSSVWQDRLRSPVKTKTSLSSVAPRSPRYKPYNVTLSKSPRSAWRRRPLLDEDSQNTLTEVARITRPLKPDTERLDEESQPVPDEKQIKSKTGLPPHTLPENWPEPKLGWENDPAVLERRTKDLTKGYSCEAYKQYLDLVDKKCRVKGVHPRTPNKHLKMPRRSWDTQVRVWRRLIHATVNAEIPSDASFLSSNCSETNDHDVNEMKIELEDDLTLIRADREADENTMKVSSNDNVKGPTDFSILSSDTLR